MKLIIDIPEITVNNIKYYGTFLDPEDEEILRKTFRNSQPFNDVIDKIRVEIKHLHDWAFTREEILKIIDKYKVESEVSE